MGAPEWALEAGTRVKETCLVAFTDIRTEGTEEAEEEVDRGSYERKRENDYKRQSWAGFQSLARPSLTQRLQDRCQAGLLAVGLN